MLACACASEICAVMGCQRVRSIREQFAASLVQSTPLNCCNCIGPQGGQPLCPCQMRGVVVKGGRYVMPERDLGAAT